MSIGLAIVCVLIALAYIGMCLELTFEIMKTETRQNEPMSRTQYVMGCVFIFIYTLMIALFIRAVIGYAELFVRIYKHTKREPKHQPLRFYPDANGHYRGKYVLQQDDIIDADELFEQMPVHNLVMVEVPKGVMAYLKWNGDVNLIETDTYYLSRTPTEILLTPVPDASTICEDTLFVAEN